MAETSRKRRFFIYAPPLKGTRPSRRKPPAPPFPNAEPWQCSVYYFWWEYLRRHEGYRATCEAGGKGAYAALYADMGNVHEGDFWSWWVKHDVLFAEPMPREVAVVAKGQNINHAARDVIYLSVPLENTLKLSTLQFRRLIEKKLVKRDRRNMPSEARYKVATKPILPSLHVHLKVWDTRRDNPDATLEELADMTGVDYNHVVNGETLAIRAINRLPDHDIRMVLKRRKELVVQRHLRIAEQYIENVAEHGTFPLRSKR